MCKMLLFVVVCVALLFSFGCNRGDFKAQTVIEGQPAPFDGFNFGPDTYVLQGQSVKVTGVVIWIKGVDPNSIVGKIE
ncbi:MAG: hypothetical protein ACTSWQ_09820 [Candidatus Thorarchaeota archaeon]